MRLEEKIFNRLKGKRIGYSVGDKKRRKLNFDILSDSWKSQGLEFIEIDVKKLLEEREHFDIVVHKWSDLLASASTNPADSKIVKDLKNYFQAHPETIMLDPLSEVETLVNRSRTYTTVSRYSKKENSCIHIPNFVKIPERTDKHRAMKLMQDANIRFPIVCKPIVAHGSSLSHTMSIVFNEAGLKDMKLPCVAQQFINHNADLFKIFVIGNEHYCVRRPSIKNFRACDRDTIIFNSHEVSKARSSSFLNECDEKISRTITPDETVITNIVRTLRKALGLKLFGIDVITDIVTGLHYIIDVNFFPGYDGVPNFSLSLLKLFYQVIEQSDNGIQEMNGHQNGLMVNGHNHHEIAS